MIYVVGKGGIGQTKLLRVLGNAGVATNNRGDKDGLKHTTETKKLPANSKIIYLHGSSFYSLCSLFRRRYQKTQLRKLGNIHNFAVDKTKKWSIEEYFSLVTKNGIDLFGFYEQASNFANNTVDHDFLFWDMRNADLKPLQEFVGADVSYVWKSKKIDKYSELKKNFPVVWRTYSRIDSKIELLFNVI